MPYVLYVPNNTRVIPHSRYHTRGKRHNYVHPLVLHVSWACFVLVVGDDDDDDHGGDDDDDDDDIEK